MRAFGLTSTRVLKEAGLGTLTPAFLGKLFCLSLLIFFVNVAHVQAESISEAPAPPTLRYLRISGAKTIPTAKLMEELTMPLPSRWPWKKPPEFKPEELENDLERLKGLYRRYGFYHATITSQVIQAEDGRVDVQLNIEEGPWVKVTRVEVNLAPTPGLPDLAELKGQSPIKPGDRFEEAAYDALKRLYLNYLTDHGYPRAKVEGQVLLDDTKDTAEITVTVNPGPLCYFGEVRIKGDLGTPRRVILRKLTFKEGDLFSFKELYESQQRLYGLDLFKSVLLTPAEVPPEEHHIPILIETEEKKQRSLKMGMGYGDEDQFRARLSLRLRNFGGAGRMLDLDGKYSYLENRVQGNFFNPLIFATNFDLVIQSGLLRQYLPSFTDKAIFTNARLERDLPWRFRAYVGHGLEFARPYNISANTLISLGETQPGKLYRSSMALLGLRQETVDNVVDPHRGGTFFLGGEAAPDFLGSNMQFVRTVLDARRYHSLGNTNFILAGRVKFGVIEPIQATSDIPIYRRFFAGGLNSVRGYRLDYLGPRSGSGAPLGGQSVLEGSLEARIPIYKEFRAVAFMDFGNVFFKVRDTDLGQIKYSPGVGLRYHTLIGPLGLDVGFPLNPIDPTKDRYHFNFTIGQNF
jgi:outer membrane protein assembly complex protein YaeT